MAIVMLASSPQASDPYCACIDTQSTAAALQRVTNLDWDALNEADLARMWPQASRLPCEASRLSGIDSVAEGIERCCGSCGTCGGPFFYPEGSPTHELSNIHVSVCRESPDGVLSELKRLVDVTVPEEIDALYEEGWTPSEETGRTLNEYRWSSHGAMFNLRVLVGPWNDSAYGSFDLVRCDGVTVLEHWDLEDGTTLSITEAEARIAEDGDRQFRFSYETRCAIADYECLKSEWRILWPRLRLMADREDTSVVFLSSQACTFGGMTVSPMRNLLGEWELPW